MVTLVQATKDGHIHHATAVQEVRGVVVLKSSLCRGLHACYRLRLVLYLAGLHSPRRFHTQARVLRRRLDLIICFVRVTGGHG